MGSYIDIVPWVKRRLVVVPPMAFTSRSELTIAVAQAGDNLTHLTANNQALWDSLLAVDSAEAVLSSLGYDTETFTKDLSLVLSALHSLDVPYLPEGLSPFGVGFILWTTPIEILNRVFPGDGVTPHPAAIWLFAGKFEEWIPRIRDLSPDTVIFVQVGSVQVS